MDNAGWYLNVGSWSWTVQDIGGWCPGVFWVFILNNGGLKVDDEGCC